MKITDFAVSVAMIEGGKINLPIAQIKEVMRVINKLLNGKLYRIIRRI